MSINLTLLGQAISLFIFVWFCMKYVWPPIIQALQDREKKIADGLASADLGQKTLVDANQKLADAVAEGRTKAAEIIKQAEKRGNEIIDTAKQTAKAESVRQIEAAASEIEQEKEKARQALKQKLALLVVSGAEQILMREVDQNVHNDLLDKLSAEL